MQNYSNSLSHQRIYLDYNATTPHLPALRSRWIELIDYTGNPSSIHFDSRVPKTVIRETRQKIAELLSCSPLEIVFNSGASEGNSSVLRSAFDHFKNQKTNPSRNEFLISQVEHPSVQKTADYLISQGAIIHFIPVSKDGMIDLDFIREKLSAKTTLVSVMYANNETGTVFPIKEISELAHAVGAFMHSDCVQLLGKANVEFADLGVDYATFSAHKLYSIKGTGFCYIRKSSPWVPLIHGGGQERGRRGGTENVIGIAALNIVLDEFKNCESKIESMSTLRDLMEQKIRVAIPDVAITAEKSSRISNTSSLVIDGIDGETLLMTLDLKGFSVSTGAACSSGNPEPSPVLLAMGLTRQAAQSSLRVSLGWATQESQIHSFVQTLSDTVQKLREINSEEKKKSHAI